jgi:ABC-type nickel/cobalt efflux system permease component RcnA
MPAIDTDGDGEVTEAEGADYAERKTAELMQQQQVEVDGTRVELAAGDPAFELISGTGGLPYLRLDVTYVGTIPGPSTSLVYYNNAYPQAEGWREVTAVGVGGRVLVSSDVPEESASQALHAYPQDAFENPLRVLQAELAFEPVEGVPAPTTEPASETPPPPDDGGGGERPKGWDAKFADLVTRASSPGVIVVSLLLAIGFGILHALAPGHGKSLMAAYLVGSGTRFRQAAGVGMAIAVMHTGSVIVLFLIVRSFESVFPGRTVYSGLGLVSGLIAMGLGLWMLVTRLRARRERAASVADAPEPEHVVAAAHAHPEEGHLHPDGHVHHEHDDHGHEHPALPPGTSLLSRPGLAALAVAGGLVPSPGALLVLTASVAASRTTFGLALVVAFSLGLAGALTAVGTLAVGARMWSSRHAGRLGSIVPVVGALAVVGVGLFLVVRAVAQL